VATNTFGVDAQRVIDSLGHGTLANAKPASAQITRWLAGYGGTINGMLTARGLDPDIVLDAGDTQALYHQCALALECLTAGKWHKMNQRNDSSLGDDLMEEGFAWIEQLKASASVVVGKIGHGFVISSNETDGSTPTLREPHAASSSWPSGTSFN
jgi:hypothetical protein